MYRRTTPVLLTAVLVACGGSGEPGARTADAPAETSASSEPTGSPAAPATSAPAAAPATTPADGATATTAATTAATAPQFVPEALQLTAPLVGGGDIELTTLAGRPVLLWFWAPW
jgi:hypothetical protein